MKIHKIECGTETRKQVAHHWIEKGMIFNDHNLYQVYKCFHCGRAKVELMKIVEGME